MIDMHICYTPVFFIQRTATNNWQCENDNEKL